MKTKNPELLTSKPANQNPLWQEIPEDSAETFKGGGDIAFIFCILDDRGSVDPTTRRI